MSFAFFHCHLKRISEGSSTFFPVLIVLSFSLFIVLAPSVDLISWAVRYDEKRILQIALLLLSTCWTLISRQGAEHFLGMLFSLPRLSRLGLATVAFLGFISSWRAPSTEYAFMELCLFILLIGFSLTAAIIWKRYTHLVICALLASICASAFFYEVTFFSSYVGIFIQGNPLVLPEPFSGFSSIRFFNQYQIWTMPLIVLPFLLYPRLFASIQGLLIILAVGWWVLLFASQSRGALLAISIATITTLLIFRRGAWPSIKATLLTAIGGWGAYLFLFIYIPDMETKTRLAQLTEDPARLHLWQLALDMISENPWLGVGPMHYAYYPNHIAAHPHNSLLQIAAEWGLPVAIILVVLVCWGVYAWSTKYFRVADTLKSNHQHHLWIGLFCSLTSGMAHSMVSGVIVMPLSQTLLAVITGLMLGLYYETSLPAAIAIPTIQTTTLRVLAGVIMAVMLWLLTPNILLKMESKASVSQGQIFSFGPRFWQEGGIPH